MAKEKQAAEANKNANILLEELDLERSREESRKAAAARRRERKRRKKREKQEQVFIFYFKVNLINLCIYHVIIRISHSALLAANFSSCYFFIQIAVNSLIVGYFKSTSYVVFGKCPSKN